MKKINFLLLLFMCLVSYNQVNAQCVNGTQWPFGTTDATDPCGDDGIIEINGCVYTDEYSLVLLRAGETYEFTATNNDTDADTYISITDDSDGALVDGLTPVTYTAGATDEVVRVHLTIDDTCAGEDVCNTSSVECTSCGPIVSPIANDLCADAVDLGSGTGNIDGTTIDAQPSCDAPDFCVTGITSPDVWYTFTAVSNGVASFDLCGTGYDTKIAMYEGTCGALTCITGDDDSAIGECDPVSTTLQSFISGDVELGKTYYVRVGGFSANTGDFTLNFSIPTCNIICPDDITVSAAAGTCGADVTIDMPTLDGAACQGFPTNVSAAGGPFDYEFNFSGQLSTTTGSVTVDPADVAAGDVTVSLTYQGDHDDANEEVTVFDEAFNTVATLAQTAALCDEGTITFTIPAADYNAAAADGSFELSLNSDSDVNDNCPTNAFSFELTVPTSYELIRNSLTGDGTDPSGTFPVGVTEITFSTLDVGGALAECTMTVTVTDDEDPTIACPADIFVNLGPGECDATISYAVAVADNCPLPGPPLSLTLNNSATTTNGNLCTFGGDAFSMLQVYDLAALGVTEDFMLSSVDGVLAQADEAFDLTANIYSIDAVPGATITAANLTLLASGSTAITTTFGFSAPGVDVNIPVSTMVPAGTILVVELSVPTSAGGLLALGTSTAGITSGATGSSYFTCGAAGINNPVQISGVFATAVDPVIALNGFEILDAQAVQSAGLASGSAFPLGTTTNTFTVTDAAGNTATCSFDVTVNPFVVTNNTMTCNSLVHVTVDENCQAVVGADQILEGNQYGCYDDYAVLFDEGPLAGQPLVVGAGNVGETVKVRVVAPGGQVCWGYILVEDKNIPDLACEDITLKCDDPTDPGSLLAEAASAASFPTLTVTTGPADSYSTTVDNAGIGELVDLNVTVNTTHTWVGDISISVTSPSGTTVSLIERPGNPATGLGCNNAAGQNMSVVMDDEATADYAALEAQCPPVGTFQPLNALSAFDGESITGTWTLTVDDAANGDGGDFDVTLNITSSGVVPYPVPSTATVIPAGPNTYTVLGFDPCGPATLTYTDVDGGDMCSGTITRNWSIEDGSGNIKTCTQNITITPTTIADVIGDIPSDVTIECGDALPAPLSDLGCANIDVQLEGTPVIIDKCGGPGSNSYKMLRKYVIVDWCTTPAQTEYFTQTISVVDTEAPVLTCPADVVAGTTSNDCSGNVALPMPTFTDCSDDSEVSLVPSIGTWNPVLGAWIVSGLPAGTHTATWTATDACGNESTCDFNVTIEDNIVPIAVCDETTTVGLGTAFSPQNGIPNTPNGQPLALVDAETFDDGSTDNCGIVSMLVRRMDNGACLGFDATPFGPTVPFYCCDIGSIVMVEFQVRDAAGNTNSCMVEVEVQDKIDPIIVCPAPKTINCDDDIDNLGLTGQATATDNCYDVTPTYSDISNTVDCGEGTILRLWSVSDGATPPNFSSCIQTITVVKTDIFTIQDTECRRYFPLNVLGADGEFHTYNDDVEWPCDIELDNCMDGTEPADLANNANSNPVTGQQIKLDARPTIFEGSCDNIAVTHQDTPLGFGAADGACLKILRKWIVIDWCQANANQDPTQVGPGVWHYTQVIKVVNDTPPTITGVNLPAVIENFQGNLGVCGAEFAAFEINVTGDNCTPASDFDVSWEFALASSGQVIFSGTGLSATGSFTDGDYKVTFTVNDQCGNEGTLVHYFTVVDRKLPTPVCILGLSTVTMPVSGEVLLWASDFESGSSYDNCTPYNQLLFSFSEDVDDISVVITCSDIPTDGFVPVELWATDAAGNQNFCPTFVQVVSAPGVCPTQAVGAIEGTIANEDQEVIEDVTVNVSGDLVGALNPIVTGPTGTFVFENLADDMYEVAPEKDFNYLNGVTTYDLVLISKHILGTEVFDSPYKYIAADANNTKTITTLDIVKLRALILHIDDELAANTSWRFVDGGYTFTTNNPLTEDYPEVMDIEMNGPSMVGNFTAVKIGDVNGTASPNSLLGTDTRTFNGKLALQLDAAKVAAGEEFTVDFRAKDFNNIAGYQFTLGFDNSAVDFVDVTSNLAGLSTENFGLTKLNEGVITTSWNENRGVSVDNNEVLFSMTFLANSTVSTEDLFAINSRYTEAEAYNGTDLFDVVLEFNGSEVANGFELFQNTPNPFKAETTIGFNLPQAGEVTLKVYDVAGRVLTMVQMDAAKGYNSVNINRADLDATGVLYYQVETATETATKKMIIVD